MDEQFASMPLTNATMLCVGSITNAEAESLRADGINDDGFGYYLFLADEREPRSPVEVLAKFFSASEASRFARMLETRAYA